MKIKGWDYEDLKDAFENEESEDIKYKYTLNGLLKEIYTDEMINDYFKTMLIEKKFE